ncbi:family 16 glycoside hydrolase [Rubinisphaera margarita]|uniref:family 16 glycoside hydrolase n=1 Tax=Rubinisphaera margarita TaxID=2909586 RepID=UPI001EE93971|nr:family 16 glycoside hydrolase [Rubinisphaera margarita]MCG6155962.1 PQQ-dependent sugar dehydrogenase [Rubinisphaera margarita]
MKLCFSLLGSLLLGSLLAMPVQAEQNTLTEAEKLAGWELLFDGKSADQFRNYQADGLSDGWVVENGVLTRKDKGAGDIITKKQYDSFELSIQYRISEEGNSGLMFHVQETEKRPWQTGPEIQIQDNVDGHDPQKAGWLYQLYKPARAPWQKKAEDDAGLDTEQILDATRPAGEWNEIYLRVTPNQSEVMMNGVSYYRFQKGSDEWNKRVAESKFSAYENFGKPTTGHICLQDHNDLVSFRNIKIRELPAENEVPDPSHGELSVKPVNAFPELTWENWDAVDEKGKVRPLRPIVITHANDGSGRMFVATQHGTIHVFPEGGKTKQTIEFLDIEEQVAPYTARGANEEGFLGLAFHPKYKDNGKFYVYYTSAEKAHTSVVSEFSVSKTDPNKADPKSERVLWTLEQPFANHNGGTIEFGHDGYLYIGLGDGGSANDPFDNGQDKSTLLGSLLRIDVDSKSDDLAYGIPKDNPFASKDGQKEIYAYGFRNIWRFSFDRETGDLWLGDVGQNLWEEIDVVEKGKNYGWNRYEGTHPFGNRSMEDADNAEMPVWEYDHQVGKSITSGYVYRGPSVKDLTGKFVYADYVTGKLWALDYDVANKKLNGNYSIESDKMPVLTFGEDEDGELYFSIETANGRGIYKFASSK